MSGGGPGATKLGQNVPGQAISQSFIEEHLVAKTRTGKIVSEAHFDKILAKVEAKMKATGEDITSTEGKKKIIRKALKGEAKDQCARSISSFGAVFCDCNAPSVECKADCDWNEAFGTGNAPGDKKVKDFCTASMKTHKEYNLAQQGGEAV